MIFLLVDCSGSTAGTLLGSLKNILEEISEDCSEGDGTIVVARLGSDLLWLNDAPVDISHFSDWRRLTPGGVLNLGKCFSGIAERLGDDVCGETGADDENVMFVLVSDGLSVDEYEDGLEELRQTRIFSCAARYAVNLDDMDGIEQEEMVRFKALTDFTGDSGRVYDLHGAKARQIEETFSGIFFGN